MGPVTTLLSLPVAGPIGALQWLARQVAEAAIRELLDPGRIETALLALERRLEAGEIDEAAFEAEEARLLDELAEMRALRNAPDTVGMDPLADDAVEARESSDENIGDAASVRSIATEPPPPARPTPSPVAEANQWTRP